MERMNRMNIKLVIAIALSLSASLFPLPTMATQHDEARAPLTEGEIRKVDRETQKITIRHGPIANLDMPAMTMVFQVKDPALLDQVKAGDKVRFTAEKSGTAYIVTAIAPAR